MPREELSQVLRVLVNFLVHSHVDFRILHYRRRNRDLGAVLGRQVCPEFKRQVARLNQKDRLRVQVRTVVFLLFFVVLAHQVLHVALGELHGRSRIRADKALIFSPVVLSIRVPVHCELRDQQQRKRFLLLKLVVDV